MNVHFLSDGSDFRSRGTGGYLAKNRRNNGLFWWTILITLLMGLATFCWFFSIMVFKYPEKPFNYRLLTKLQKIEPVKQFTPETVPHGKFLGAKDLLTFYSSYDSKHFSHENDTLKRNYILNYAEENPVYVKGTYTVLQARPLTPQDVMAQGWVVRARSVDMEDVEVELLLPGAKSVEGPYKDGESFTLDNKATFGTVLHVERIGSDGICASLVPIVYGTYAVGGDQKLPLNPPDKVNVEAGWPVIHLDPNAVSAVNTVGKVAKSEP